MKQHNWIAFTLIAAFGIGQAYAFVVADHQKKPAARLVSLLLVLWAAVAAWSIF